MQELKLTLSDFLKAIQKYQLWLYLGQVEVKQKYRRSVIGPWWITISMAIFTIAMGLVFSRLFHQSMSEYLPNFTAGFLFWTFFSSTIIEGAEVFKNNAGFIKQIDLPHPVYIFKHITKQIIILFHNFIVLALVCIVFKKNPTAQTLLFVPGFILFLINLTWISLLISMLCTRFRDLTPILNSCIQIAFFVTPISWSASQISVNSLVIKLNPLFYLIDLVKSPLTGTSPMINSWVLMSTCAILGSFITLQLYSQKRKMIAFWVN